MRVLGINAVFHDPAAAPPGLINEYLQGIVRRAPRAKPEAMGMEMRVEDRREHLRDGLADQPIHRSRDGGFILRLLQT